MDGCGEKTKQEEPQLTLVPWLERGYAAPESPVVAGLLARLR